jgi:hypothetical protein
MDSLNLGFDDGEVGAGLIGLAQPEAGFRWGRGMLPEDG